MAHVVDHADVDGAIHASATKFRWWSKDSDTHSDLLSAVRKIHGDDDDRRNLISHHMRLYGSRDLSTGASDPIMTLMSASKNKYNAVQSTCETAVSRLGKNRPAASFITKGGTLKAQRQGRSLTLYVAGIFENAKVYEKGRRSFRDAVVGGTGCVKFEEVKTERGWSIDCRKVMQWEVLFEDNDARGGRPRNTYHVYYEDRERLFHKLARHDKWKNNKTKLAAMIGESHHGQLDEFRRTHDSSLVEVYEAWRLPSEYGSGDGRHVIATSAGILVDEPWEYQWTPIVMYSWQPHQEGVWGSGIAEIINGIQVQINKMLRVEEEAYRLARPWLIMSDTAKISQENLEMGIGNTIKYSGEQAPQVITHQPLSPQFGQKLAEKKAEAIDITGLSRLAAMGQKPADLESGEALRQFNALEDARHADPALNYEDYYMRMAHVIIGMSRWMADRGMNPTAATTVRRRHQTWMEEIDWKSAELKEGTYLQQVYPTSILPNQPAGRVATIQEWLRVGFIEKSEAMWLLEIPDMESHLSPQLTMYEAILDDISSILDKDEPEKPLPEPYQDLELSRQLMTAAYLRARIMIDKEDEEEMVRLTLMQRYIDHVSVLEEQAAAMQQQLPMEQNTPEVAQAPQGASLASIESGEAQ